MLVDVNIHRIIRRSTTFGAPYDPAALSEEDDETSRGLYFLFINVLRGGKYFFMPSLSALGWLGEER